GGGRKWACKATAQLAIKRGIIVIRKFAAEDECTQGDDAKNAGFGRELGDDWHCVFDQVVDKEETLKRPWLLLFSMFIRCHIYYLNNHRCVFPLSCDIAVLTSY